MDYFIGICWGLVNPQLLTRNRQNPMAHLSSFLTGRMPPNHTKSASGVHTLHPHNPCASPEICDAWNSCGPRFFLGAQKALEKLEKPISNRTWGTTMIFFANCWHPRNYCTTMFRAIRRPQDCELHGSLPKCLVGWVFRRESPIAGFVSKKSWMVMENQNMDGLGVPPF